MKQSLLASAAAAALLVTSISIASAQGPGGKNEGQAASTGQTQSAPSKPEGGAVMTKPDGAKSENAAHGAAQKSASDTGKSAQQSEPARPGAAATGTKSDMKASETKPSDTKSSAETKSAPAGAVTNDAAKPTPSGSAASGTPSANRSAALAPPAEKRTQITAAFKQEKIAPATNVNFNISVGTVVPASVHFYPVPRRIVEIYPEWSGFEVIFVHGRYVIIRPQTREIVYIIES